MVYYVVVKIKVVNFILEKFFVLGCFIGLFLLGMYKVLIDLNKKGIVLF